MKQPIQTVMVFRGMKIPVMRNATKSEMLVILNRMFTCEKIKSIQPEMKENGEIIIHEWQ